MSTDRDVTRIVRSWLEEGATALPDRVLDAVLDQLPATPQRRARRPAWRLLDMNTPTRLAVAAAAVVALAVLGVIAFPKFTGVAGPGPTAIPTPTVAPVPMPSSGTLAAGTYVMTPFVEIARRQRLLDAAAARLQRDACGRLHSRHPHRPGRLGSGPDRSASG